MVAASIFQSAFRLELRPGSCSWTTVPVRGCRGPAVHLKSGSAAACAASPFLTSILTAEATGASRTLAPEGHFAARLPAQMTQTEPEGSYQVTFQSFG